MGIPGFSSIADRVSNTWNKATQAVSEGAEAVTSTVSNAASSVTRTVHSTATHVATEAAKTYRAVSSDVSDFATRAQARASDLGRQGMDIGRRGVEAVKAGDVRGVASAAREGISLTTQAAGEGFSGALDMQRKIVSHGADFARNTVDGDDIVSRTFRGVVTGAEQSSRLTSGFVEGVGGEVIDTVGAAGQLAVTATEMQYSAEARAEYGDKIVTAAGNAVSATGNYLTSVADDPSRLTRDAGGALNAASGFVGDKLDSYGQAIAEGRPELIGHDLGVVATYVVPVGGGPVRGAATAAVRAGTETVVRSTVATATREGSEVAMRTIATRTGTEATIGTTGGIAAASRQTGREVAIYRDGLTGKPRIASSTADALPMLQPGEAITSGRGVFFVDDKILPYLDKPDATLGQPGAHFFMPLEDSAVVVDAASAYRYTGGAPSLERAYTGGGKVFGIEFPLEGMMPRIPTAADANGFEHYLEGGQTALRLGDGGGFLINPTREFVVPGGGAMPPGSTLFRITEDGSRVPMRTW